MFRFQSGTSDNVKIPSFQVFVNSTENIHSQGENRCKRKCNKIKDLHLPPKHTLLQGPNRDNLEPDHLEIKFDHNENLIILNWVQWTTNEHKISWNPEVENYQLRRFRWVSSFQQLHKNKCFLREKPLKSLKSFSYKQEWA